MKWFTRKSSIKESLEVSSFEESLFESPRSSGMGIAASDNVSVTTKSLKRPTSWYRTPPLHQDGFKDSQTGSSHISSSAKGGLLRKSSISKTLEKRSSQLFRLRREGSTKRTSETNPVSPKVNVSLDTSTPKSKQKSSSEQLPENTEQNATPSIKAKSSLRPKSEVSELYEAKRLQKQPTQNLKRASTISTARRRTSSTEDARVSTARQSYRFSSLPTYSLNPTVTSIDTAFSKPRRTSTATHSVSYTLPVLNEENELKVKIYVGRRNEDAMALKLRKDKLNSISELHEVILYKIRQRHQGLSRDAITLNIFFKNDLNSVPLNPRRRFVLDAYQDLLLDYVMNKSKLYVQATY